MTITFGCWFTQCARNEETHTRPDNQQLKNSASTFIYNMIPQNSGAEITPEYNTAVNTFAVNLLDELYQSDSFFNTNLIVSPFSVSRNLAIITEATTGEAKQELLDALGGQRALDDAHDALSQLLYADNSVVLECADAIWVDSTKYLLQPSFIEMANTKYGVEAAGLNFGDVNGSVTAINNWIAANTNNRIKNAIDNNFITAYTVSVLASTIYFEADWTSPFDATKTKSHLFAAPNGSVQVPMMESSHYFQTRKTDEFENVKLYYGSNNKDYFYLDVYMPTAISIEEFIGEKCLTALGEQDSFDYGGLQMPKFFFEKSIDLKPALKSLGIISAFDISILPITEMATNKSTGNPEGLYIEKIIHKAGIKTDEEGTVAYAVTVSGLAGGSAMEDSPDVILDRPFVFFIRAGENGLVLFAGVVNDPNEKS
jgi:serpin B